MTRSVARFILSATPIWLGSAAGQKIALPVGRGVEVVIIPGLKGKGEEREQSKDGNSFFIRVL